jgi:hypothetical protein
MIGGFILEIKPIFDVGLRKLKPGSAHRRWRSGWYLPLGRQEVGSTLDNFYFQLAGDGCAVAMVRAARSIRSLSAAS